jgi:hypothetical protein
MEVVLFRKAYRAALLTYPMPEDVYRWGVISSASPLAFFLVSMPIAFLNTTVAVLMWLLTIPFGFGVLNRFKPAEADEYFG